MQSYDIKHPFVKFFNKKMSIHLRFNIYCRLDSVSGCDFVVYKTGRIKIV